MKRIVVMGLFVLMLQRMVVEGFAGVGNGRDEYTRRITAELTAVNPEAGAIFEKANAAREKPDFVEAERLYRDVLNRQPEWYHAKRRLADVILQQGRRDEALQMVRLLMTVAPVPENRAALIRTLLARDTKHAAPSAAELGEAISHSRLLAADETADSGLMVFAGMAAELDGDETLLRQVIARLDRSRTEMGVRHYFAWVLALRRGDFEAAEASINAAAGAGLSPENIAGMRTFTRDSRPLLVRVGSVAWRVAAVWAGVLVALLIAGLVLSAVVLRNSERLACTPVGQELKFSKKLASCYRFVLWASCAFYYLSVPLVLAAVIAVPVLVILACLYVGHIPVRLVILAVIIAFVTIGSVIKSLFVRGRDEDPGDKLDLATQPRVKALLDEVAGRLGTRPVDNVYLTPGTEVAVVERGGLRKQMAGQTERCLILGIAVLEGMRIRALRAVLAHEYGHFINRDTAGGGFALAVRRSLLTMARHLAVGGAATWLNPAWLFLNGFYRVFLRISHGASRLQEVLADRWAAMLAGGSSFEEGLRHVIARSVRFDDHANAAIKEVVDSKAALANLYRFAPVAVSDEKKISGAIETSLNAKPSGYDTHPAPAQRFAWVRAITVKESSDPAWEAEAWTLFDNRELLERRMTDKIRDNIAKNYKVVIPAERGNHEGECAG